MKKSLFIPALLIIAALVIIGALYINSRNTSLPISEIYSIQAPTAHGGTPVAQPINAQGVPVLIYHTISAADIKGSYGSISLSLFREQLDYLKQEGYTTISLDDLYGYMTSSKNIQNKSIVLSFDDTNESDYTIAFPELKNRGFKGVFFTVGSRAMASSWTAKLQEMYSGGMEIASHTMNHRYSGGGPDTKGVRTETDSDETIRYELEESKRILENITGSEIKYLAWPGDSYTESMIRTAQDAGYKGLFMAKTAYTANVMEHPVSISGFNNAGDEVLHIKRITVHGANSIDDFKSLLRDGIYPRF